LAHTQILLLFKQRNQLVNQVTDTLLTTVHFMCGVLLTALGKMLVTLKVQLVQQAHKV
jgi:hypothetical protein